MPVYNTLVPVVALVEAAGPEEAIIKLEDALRRADFEPYQEGPPAHREIASAFLSENDAQIAQIR
jgi:hypothetical protein